MYKIFSISLVALALAACNSGGKKTTEYQAPASNSVNTGQTPATGPANSTNASGTSALPTNSATPTSNEATVALNPEHGKPGHRCDIPVGAPLNSPANNANPPVTNNNVQPMAIQPQPQTQPAAKGQRLNPPHGEPGHDCNVPVGQPLNN